MPKSTVAGHLGAWVRKDRCFLKRILQPVQHMGAGLIRFLQTVR